MTPVKCFDCESSLAAWSCFGLFCNNGFSHVEEAFKTWKIAADENEFSGRLEQRINGFGQEY